MLALDLQRYLIHSDYLKEMFHIDRVLHFAKFEDGMSFCYETSCFIVDVKPAQLELYVTPLLLENGDYDVLSIVKVALNLSSVVQLIGCPAFK